MCNSEYYDVDQFNSAIFTLGKLLEMFSEIASSHVTYFWFTTCSVSLPVVLLWGYHTIAYLTSVC